MTDREITRLSRLDDVIRSAGIPINGVSGITQETARVDFKAEATNQQRQQAAAILAGLDWTDAGDASWLAGKAKARASAASKAGSDPDDRLIRAIAAELFNQDQAMALRINGLLSILTANQRNAIIANGFPASALPARTMDDFIVAVKARIAAEAA